MLATKFIKLADKIESRINSGKYQKRIPSIRQLALDFDVSPATMQRAVRELVIKGLIIPSGPSGNLINEKTNIRPQTGIIGIFCNSEIPDVQNDILLHELRDLVRNDGYHPLFMNSPGVALWENEKFWCSNWLDGYVFAYSTINKDLARMLKRHSIPFVVANKMTSDCGANWVDFDIPAMLEQALNKLVEAGHERIGISLPQMPLASQHEYLLKKLTACMKRLKVYHPELICEAELLGLVNARKNCKQHVDYYSRLEFQPTAIIVNSLSPQMMIDEFNLLKCDNLANADFIYVGDESLWKTIPCAAINYSYKELAASVWTLFRENFEQPAREARQILLTGNEKLIVQKFMAVI